jgi:hypothetical protein
MRSGIEMGIASIPSSKYQIEFQQLMRALLTPVKGTNVDFKIEIVPADGKSCQF